MPDIERFIRRGALDYRLLGQRLAERRQAERLGLRDVAAICGVSYSTLSRLERATAKPDLETLKRILLWLELPVSSLLMGGQPIRAHLRARKQLVPEAAGSLAEIALIAQNNFYQSDTEPPEVLPEPKSVYRRLRKHVREELAIRFRTMIRRAADEPIDPFDLAVKGMQVARLDEITDVPAKLRDQLLGSYTGYWSAITLPTNDAESAWLIILNSQHPRERQRATLMEEYCHIFLDHSLTTLSHLEGQTFRDYNDAQEKDAFALGAAILIPMAPLSARIGRGESAQSVGQHFGVSQQLVEYRIKVTGAWFEYKFRQHLGEDS